MLKVSAIIMAAGISSRMGKNKLTLSYKGASFFSILLSVIQKVSFHEVILVISKKNAIGLTIPKGITVVINDQPQLGQSHSVQLGTSVASGEGYLYLTVDQPLLTPEILNQILQTASQEKIIIPVDCNGKPASPVFFGAKFRQELLQVQGKTGGKAVRNAHPEAREYVKIEALNGLQDIDTPAEYQELLNER